MPSSAREGTGSICTQEDKGRRRTPARSAFRVGQITQPPTRLGWDVAHAAYTEGWEATAACTLRALSEGLGNSSCVVCVGGGLSLSEARGGGRGLRADRTGGVKLGEAGAVASELVDVGGDAGRVAVAREVAVAQICQQGDQWCQCRGVSCSQRPHGSWRSAHRLNGQ